MKEYLFLLRAETPIAHHQEVFGNAAILMRRRTRMFDGTFSDIPIITGDTMRHGLREAITILQMQLMQIGEHSLTAPALRLLFNGGMVSGNGGGSSIKLDQYRELIDLVPSLALL